MDKLTNDIFEWDVVNWSKSLNIWKKYTMSESKKCLEIGGRNGGLSLWLALRGYSVICSDLENPHEIASPLHEKYLSKNASITYEEISATSIPYENEFDIIIFKSVLGAVGRDNNKSAQKIMIQEIYKALKKGGVLLFAENLTGSNIHAFFRKKFVKWGNSWRYVSISEIDEFLKQFESYETKTFGFLGAFGRNKAQRNFLGYFDKLIFDRIVDKRKHYIICGAATK